MTTNEITEGIVLSLIPYNDHTQLVHIYTERYGKLTYRCPLSRSKKNGPLRTAMAPMTLVELTVRQDPRKVDLLQLNEVQVLLSPYLLAMSDPGATAQCLYLAELIDHSVREVEQNKPLWSFLRQGLELLATSPAGQANFHLIFTLRLCQLLGFHIDDEEYSAGMLFDISEGRFTIQQIYHPYFLTAESAAWLHLLLQTDFATMEQLRLTRQQRSTLLDMLLLFMQMHIPEMGQLKSIEVLKELFN